MGYTHYWWRPPNLNLKAYAAAIADCRRMLALTSIALAGFDGTGAAVFDETDCAFNGPGSDGCETFSMPLQEEPEGVGTLLFRFCKTGRHPYDLCVQIALIIFAHHAHAGGDEFILRSDGDEQEWKKARALCQNTLGYGADLSLHK